MKDMILRSSVTALLALAPTALLAQPVTPGEVALHIDATGEVLPDSATVSADGHEFAPDRAGAETKLASKQASATARLRAAGIADKDIVFTSQVEAPADPNAVSLATGVVPPAPTVLTPPPFGRPANPQNTHPMFDGTFRFSVTVRNVQKLAEVYSILGVQPFLQNQQSTQFHFADPESADRLAVDHAFAKARREADTYAAALHMKVGRVEKVSNTHSQGSEKNIVEVFAQLGARGGNAAEVLSEKTAVVSIDYVLVP